MARTSVCNWARLVFLFTAICSCNLVCATQSNGSCDGTTDDGGELKPIYIAFMTAFSGSFVSSGTIPAVQLAIERVNNDSTLLRGYRLNYTTVYDTQCKRTTSLSAFFKMLVDAPPNQYPLAILGMGCAVATEPVAEINDNWNLPMMGYVSAAPSLSDRNRFKSYYRTYPSDAIFVPALVTLIKTYGWKKICIITENANTFITNDRMLKNELPVIDVDVSVQSFIFDIGESSLTVEQRIEDIVSDRTTDNPHVFFVNTFEDKARIILCKLYQLAIRSPNYLLITHGWYQARWWSKQVAKSFLNCSDIEMMNMLHGVIAVQQFPGATSKLKKSESRLSADEFDRMYRAKLTEHPDLVYQFEATNAFDAVWALALAMDNASQSLCSGDIGYCSNTRVTENIPLENYTFYNDRIECLLNRSLNNMEFEGVSGSVKFDENGTRVQREVFIQQYRILNNNMSKAHIVRAVFGIVHFDDNGTVLYMYTNNENSTTVWPDGIPPDGTPVKVFSGVHLTITVIYDMLAIVGIVFAITCVIFNIVFRDRKVIKLTSPALNYFIVAGAIILYLSVIVQTLPGTNFTITSIRCYAGIMLRIFGYSLAFSIILAKIWRIYYIFYQPSLDKKVLKSWHLLLFASAVMSITVVLLIVEYSVPSLRPQPISVPDRQRGESTNEHDVIVHYCVYACGGNYFATKVVQVIELAYLLILQLVGIILAFQTRKIKVKVLNDSKWVTAIIYSSSLCVVVVILSELALIELLDAGTALLNAAILTATTIFLTMVFIPKMVNLYKDPYGKQIFVKSNRSVLNRSSRKPTTALNKQLPTRVFKFSKEDVTPQADKHNEAGSI